MIRHQVRKPRDIFECLNVRVVGRENGKAPDGTELGSTKFRNVRTNETEHRAAGTRCPSGSCVVASALRPRPRRYVSGEKGAVSSAANEREKESNRRPG
jgi:hypothetical protein